MYLKKIEVKGFKSFADRTAIKPAFGVTCVVGPNGSGKSNITDAIRWVLGEQGAKVLRGEKMEDIIFSGTGKRASLGFAEVKLVIDNADGMLAFDFDEIEVVRRLYRSGESEYRINDEAVRLRDIRDLFADTGVGLEGYSIIGQGRIDEIVGASPQDRRLLFDEAAGITAFKMKKTEAEKQLKSAENDLKEVSIRLEEAEGSIEVLKAEAEKAERYAVMNERLRTIHIHEYAEAFLHTERQLERMRQKHEESAARIAQIEAAREESQARRDAFEAEQADLRGKLRRADQERYEIAGKIRAADTEILLADEKLHGIQKQIRSEESRQKGEDHSYRRRVERRAELRSEIGELEGAIERVGAEIAVAANEAGLHSTALADLRLRIEDLKREEREFLTNSDVAKNKIAENAKRRETLQSEYASVEESVRSEENLEELRREFASAEEENRKLLREEDACRTRKNEVKARIRHLEKDAVRLKAEADFHRDSLSSHSDYEYAVQTILKQKPADIYGVVGELFHVDRKYEEAIETALGRNIGILICDDANTARRHIEEMRTRRGGRVSFLPLDDVRVSDRLDLSRFEIGGGFEGVAADLISCDEKFRGVFEVLLGGILIASDFESGRRLLSLGKRVVTLKGEVFIPGGIVTGGATARSGKILARKRMFAESEGHLKETEEELRILRAEEGRIEEEELLLQGRANESTARLSEMRLNLNLLEAKLEQEEKLFAERRQRYETEKRRLESEFEEVSANILRYEEGLVLSREGIERSREELAALEKASDEGVQRLTELKIEQAKAEEQRTLKEAEAKRLSEEISEIDAQRSGAAEELEGLRRQCAEIEEGKASLERDRRALLPQMEACAEHLTELETGLAAFEEEARALSAELRELEEERRKAGEKAGRQQAECIRAESDLARMKSELLGIYEIGVDEALERYCAAKALQERCEAAPTSERGAAFGSTASGIGNSDGAVLLGSEFSGAELGGAVLAAAAVDRRAERSPLLPGVIPAWIVPSLSEDTLSEYVEDDGEEHGEESAQDEEFAKEFSEQSDEKIFASLAQEKQVLQEAIRELGEVRPSAADEYRYRSERIRTVRSERQEIVDAIARTNDLISEMAKEIHRRFHQGLEQIERSFEYAFTRLFGGGEAKIRLVGGDEILSSGVEIVVQPPGKKLRNLSLLSGGEKALTAIALLFAFMEKRPSPFYILDEIEAPLDDVNLIKFTEFLKEYSEKAQFLVITHRRATMEIADAIFGVTMEEYGVSKVISAKLPV